MHNWTYITQHLYEWSMQGYNTTLGFLFYPIFFSGIIIYVYLKYESYTMLAAIVLILVAAFWNVLAKIPLFVTFLHITTAMIITGLLLYFISKRRQ